MQNSGRLLGVTYGRIILFWDFRSFFLKFWLGIGKNCMQKVVFCNPDLLIGAILKTKFKIALAALTLGVAEPVAAQQIDISTITCGDAFAMPGEAVSVIVAFIDGYTGGEAGDSVLDIGRLKNDLNKAVEACLGDPNLNFMDAMIEALPAK